MISGRVSTIIHNNSNVTHSQDSKVTAIPSKGTDVFLYPVMNCFSILH